MAAKSASPAALQILEEIGVINLPADWDIVRLERLLCDERGIAVGVMYPGDHDHAGIPLIRAGELAGSRINPRPEFRITADKHHEYRRTELAGGELLISLVGDIGRCALVPPLMAGWNVARAIAVLRFSSPADAAFVRACLMSSPLQHLMQSWSTTTVQATLNLKEIRQIPLPWPPKKERDAIVHILGTLDDKIELNRRMNETLEAMARALFKSWFADFDPVRAKTEGRDLGLPESLADLFPDSFEDSELGEVPKGWGIGRLGDLLVQRVERCVASSETTARCYVPIDCISPRSLFLTQSKSGEEAQSSLTKFYKGDLLFGAMRPYFHKVCIAPFDGITRTTVFVLFPRAKVDFAFATLLLHHPDTIDYATRHSTGSTIPYAVWSNSLEDMLVIVPPLEVRRTFDVVVRPMLDRIPEPHFQNKTLAALRDMLLPKLISGELRIKDTERFVRGGD